MTLRAVREVGSLRTKRVFRAVRGALEAGANRFGMRLVQYSVQGDHLHLMVEAADKGALATGMKGLKVRVARAANRALQRKGSLFADRYHARALRTPREVRNALVYVLNNRRKHAARHGRSYPAGWWDPCASVWAFDGWRRGTRLDAMDGGHEPPALPGARTWLLRVGWRRRGLLDLAEMPLAPPGR